MFTSEKSAPGPTDLVLSEFANIRDNRARRCVVSLEQFQHVLQNPEPTTKDTAGLWAPAIFEGDRRQDSLVEVNTALVLDIDNACEYPISSADIIEALSEQDWAFFMHTTHSNTSEREKLRLIVLIDRPITDAFEHRKALVAVFDALGRPDGVDIACWNRGRIYYLPSMQPGYKCWFIGSQPASVDALLIDVADDDPALTRRAQAAPEVHGRNNVLKDRVFAALCKSKSVDEIADEILEQDKRLHPSNPLFEDPHEPYLRLGEKPIDAARRFVRSIARSFRTLAQEGKVTTKTPENGSPGVSEPISITIQPESEFTQGFTVPDYIVDGIFAHSYLYAITAKAGTGKTALALDLAYKVANGLPFMDRKVKPGRVLYLAGENPDDIRKRCLAIHKHYGFGADHGRNIDFVPQQMGIVDHVFDLILAANVRTAQIKEPYSMVIVDTDAAYYAGKDENDNVERLRHARALRQLIDIEGRPAVVALCHPRKGDPGGDEMEPRGGGAFLGEIDCAIVMNGSRDTGIRVAPHVRKFRGDQFEPFTIKIVSVDIPGHTNALTGAMMTAAIADHMNHVEQEQAEEDLRDSNLTVLRDIWDNPDSSIRAREQRMRSLKGKVLGISKTSIKRTIDFLLDAGYIEETLKGFDLTAKGKKQLGVK